MQQNDSLFGLIRMGNRAAFEKLFRLHYASLCAFANSLIADLDASEDLVQDLFFHLWEIKEELPTETAEKSYLYKSVQNRCFNLLKHYKIREKHQEEVLGEYNEFSADEEYSEENDLQQKLRQAIEKLPPERKKVFLMHRFEEMKYREIAEKLNISVKTVENQIGKALQFLREEMKQHLPLVLLILGSLLIKIFKS